MQPSEWCAGGSYFDWQGHRMFCRIEGTGDPLLVIHGFPTASWDWWKLWPALTATYRCYAVDMLGYGYSAKPRDAEYSILRQADLQEALLAREGVTSYRMLAHDYGLSVALELLARGAKVRGTCMLNGGLFPEAHRPVLTQKLLASSIGGLIARLSSYRTFAKTMRGIWGKRPLPDDELRGMWELLTRDNGLRVMPKLIGYLAERKKYRERWVGALVKATPLRLIDGLLDPVAGAQIVKRFRELVPNPDVVELPDTGHYPQLEAVELVQPAVLEFLARCYG